MQAVGVSPNVASAEGLLQSCRHCTHLSGKVNNLTAPFQPALAAVQLLPLTDAAQSSLASQAAETEILPSADIMHRWHSGSAGPSAMTPSVAQTSAAGLPGPAPGARPLTAALESGPSTGAPVTPDLQSEGTDVSSLDADEAPAHEL